MLWIPSLAVGLYLGLTVCGMLLSLTLTASFHSRNCSFRHLFSVKPDVKHIFAVCFAFPMNYYYKYIIFIYCFKGQVAVRGRFKM